MITQLIKNLTEYNIGKDVHTKDGVKKGPYDSYVGFHEVISDDPVTTAHVVEDGKGVGIDDVKAYTQGAAVAGNDKWNRLSYYLNTPVTFAQATYNAGKDIELYKKSNPGPSDNIKTLLGNGSVRRKTIEANKWKEDNKIGLLKEFLLLALDDLRNQHSGNDIFANCGKNVPRYKIGRDLMGNIITSGAGMLAGLGLYINAKNQSLNSPNIYVDNPYEQQSLNVLSQLRDNPYNQLRAMLDVESRNRYAINQSGGLTGALKYLANVASGIGLQKNYADILYKSNAANNQYKAQWANAALQAGGAKALRMQAANQYRDEAYARAHAAREQLKQVGIANMLSNMLSYYSNEFKRRLFEEMMDIYRQKDTVPTYSLQQTTNVNNAMEEMRKNAKKLQNILYNRWIPTTMWTPFGEPVDSYIKRHPAEK